MSKASSSTKATVQVFHNVDSFVRIEFVNDENHIEINLPPHEAAGLAKLMIQASNAISKKDKKD